MSKTDDVYYHIHNQIMIGKWKPGERLSTEPELAKEFHVARKTLRSALTRLEKEGLINRLPRLGTFVHDQENTSVQRILLIMSDAPGHPFFSPIRVILPEFIKYCHSLNIECDHLDIHMVDKSLPIVENYCGIILSDAVYDHLEDKIEILRNTGLPIVVYSGFKSTIQKLHFAAVSVDRKQAFLDGLKHLTERGHRKICFLLNQNWKDFYTRTGITQQEFKQYLKANGIKSGKNSIIFLQDWKQYSLSDNDREQVLSILTGPDRPTAFYSYTDYIAFQIKQISDTQKLRIPEDVALIGFSGFLHDSLLNQYFSTVDFRYDRIAKLTVDLVLSYQHWQGKNPPPVYYAPYDIISRKSTDRCLLFEWEQQNPAAGIKSEIKQPKKK